MSNIDFPLCSAWLFEFCIIQTYPNFVIWKFKHLEHFQNCKNLLIWKFFLILFIVLFSTISPIKSIPNLCRSKMFFMKITRTHLLAHLTIDVITGLNLSVLVYGGICDVVRQLVLIHRHLSIMRYVLVIQSLIVIWNKAQVRHNFRLVHSFVNGL